jgi:hypothetical protein
VTIEQGVSSVGADRRAVALDVNQVIVRGDLGADRGVWCGGAGHISPGARHGRKQAGQEKQCGSHERAMRKVGRLGGVMSACAL